MKAEASNIVVVAGGTIGDWAVPHIERADIRVGADRGALFLAQIGYPAHIAMGDFDSVTDSELELIRRKSGQFMPCDPVHKDLTDTEMAFDWALRQHPAQIVLVGATGTRLDHALANIHLLRRGSLRGIACKIVDAHNDIHVVLREQTFAQSEYEHISLLPLSTKVAGIHLQGFQYPLFDATLEIGQSLGISNVLLAETGRISIGQGELLVIRSKD